MRFFGYTVLGAVVIGALLYFGDYIKGSAKVEVTSKGLQTINKGLDHAKDGLNNLKVENAPKAEVSND